MKIAFYLKVGQNGSVSVSKGKPNLDWDQVAIQCNLELPDMLFKKPQITASIVVNEKNVRPFDITAETADNVKQAIEQATGIQVKLSIEDNREDQ